MSGLQILPAGLDELPTYHGLWRTIWPNRPRPLDEMRHDLEDLPPEYRPTYWLARQGDAVVGYAECNLLPFSDNGWEFDVGVLPDRRSQGIGTRLYDTVDRFMAERTIRDRLTRISDDDPGTGAYLERRGYEERKRDFESQLDPNSVDPDLLERWGAPIDGIEIVAMAELDSPEFRRRLLAFIEHVRVDVPRSTPPTPIDFEFFNEHVVGDAAFRWEGSFVALANDEIVAMTGSFEGDGPDFADQWLTGVDREWRGKGVARALKAHNVRWAATNGVKTIRTDNDTRNAPMLAINDALGFVRKVGMITFGRKVG